MTTKKTWNFVRVIARPEAADPVEFVLDEFGSLGLETDHLRKGISDDVGIVGFFDHAPSIAEIRDRMVQVLDDHGLASGSIASIDSGELEDRDWLAEWKKHWRSTKVGDFVIAPPWENVDATAAKIIRIEPNMAFGTGTHETTQLCLAAIQKVHRDGYTVLDVGTGTGILAIAAAMTGANGRIVACDTDSASVAIARENAGRNGVGGRIEFLDGTADRSLGKFDLVLANLTIDVIVPILADLISLTSRYLVLSGILREQRADIGSALRELGINDYLVDEMGEWISVVVDLH